MLIREFISETNKNKMISDLLKWSLDEGAIDSLSPECEHDHKHGADVDCSCKLGCC